MYSYWQRRLKRSIQLSASSATVAARSRSPHTMGHYIQGGHTAIRLSGGCCEHRLEPHHNTALFVDRVACSYECSQISSGVYHIDVLRRSLSGFQSFAGVRFMSSWIIQVVGPWLEPRKQLLCSFRDVIPSILHRYDTSLC